jgi:CBS domain-containing protein
MNIEGILAAKGRSVATTSAETKVAEATRRMREERIGALVVTAAEGDIAGIVTDRTILWAIADQGVAVLEQPVGSIMTREVATCTAEDRVSSIMALMTERRFRHVPVLDAEGRLAGIVSIGDVVKHRLDEIQLEADAMRDYIAGAA